ncbi:MAG: TetR/AcrR family transcriptional regulator [Lachnospiraceae bacterium]|nr:TetR/AcrR family transcriptional regulator [Lachnospiraceae bacterium]
MNEKFFDLKKEKQDRMINAALKVFAMHGYRHASTDDMVREAGISKGLLFHYFGSKLGVYTFVFDYSVRYMTLELTSTIKKDETDFFELLKQKEQAKMQALRGYPYMQQFLDRCMVEDVSEALLAIEEKRNIFAQNIEGIYGQIDLSSLPAGVNGEKLWRMLELTIRGLMTQRIMDGSFQAGMLYDEICEYIEMTKGLVRK